MNSPCFAKPRFMAAVIVDLPSFEILAHGGGVLLRAPAMRALSALGVRLFGAADALAFSLTEITPTLPPLSITSNGEKRNVSTCTRHPSRCHHQSGSDINDRRNGQSSGGGCELGAKMDEPHHVTDAQFAAMRAYRQGVSKSGKRGAHQPVLQQRDWTAKRATAYSQNPWPRDVGSYGCNGQPCWGSSAGGGKTRELWQADVAQHRGVYFAASGECRTRNSGHHPLCQTICANLAIEHWRRLAQFAILVGHKSLAILLRAKVRKHTNLYSLHMLPTLIAPRDGMAMH